MKAKAQEYTALKEAKVKLSEELYDTKMEVKNLQATNAELTEYSEAQTIKIRERDTKIY